MNLSLKLTNKCFFINGLTFERAYFQGQDYNKVFTVSFQICIAKFHKNHDLVDYFVPTPNITVKSNAEKHGFDQRVEFPDQNVAKYYKIIDLEKGGWNYFTFSRLCAQNRGLLASPYNPEIAKVQIASII